jgi:DNA polymerase III gamma/tau subunit
MYIMGITLPQKRSREKENEADQSNFTFRVKISDYEVEITGTYEEVTKTLENLPNIIPNLHKAFQETKPKTVATITVKTEALKEATKPTKETYPKIDSTADCQEAVIKILETDWGKWRPRTMEELKEVMTTNELKYPARALSDTLNHLENNGVVRRWNTNTGFVYILAEKKAAHSGGTK